MNGARGPGPAVDIVIDNYNYGRFLRDAIESACAQTHEQVNVIVGRRRLDRRLAPDRCTLRGPGRP